MPKQPRDFAEPSDFLTSLGTRLNAESRESGMPVQRLRKLVAFERLLARLMTADVPTWALKGGYAMELRMRSARTTKDVDISVELRPASPSPEVQALEISDILQRAAANDLTDFFRFTVGAATQVLDGAPYGGVRFPVVSFVGAKVFEPFNFTRIHVVVKRRTPGRKILSTCCYSLRTRVRIR